MSGWSPPQRQLWRRRKQHCLADSSATMDKVRPAQPSLAPSSPDQPSPALPSPAQPCPAQARRTAPPLLLLQPPEECGALSFDQQI